MKAPMAGIPFWLYIATEDSMIGAILMQVAEGKEHIITYLSQRLIDAEIVISIPDRRKGLTSNRTHGQRTNV
jgi:hypothetical protein